jgi:cytochrome c-type biogenesis protein CcmE|tara:strand:- start:242 stop:646 length:405 start_codon:yes stop_codon:yes gene_type:complete
MNKEERRTVSPWSSWSKGLLAFSVLVITGIVIFFTVDEQSMYISVEDAVSGDYGDGDNLQIHGMVTSLKVGDCILVDGNFSIKIDISSLILPDTFAEDKSATFTGVLQVVDGEFVLNAQNVQMGCPSKYEPAEE